MNHAFGDGDVREMVLKACMRDPWSKGGGVVAYVRVGIGADCSTPGIHDMGGGSAPGGGMDEGAPYAHEGGGGSIA